jgi:prepilin-type N-terminal cleavage/methylation domain-containing protein
MSRRAFTLLELVMTVGVLAILLLLAGNNARKNAAYRQLSMSLKILERFLALAVTTARLDHVYVRILWDVADPASGREQQFFLLTSTKIGSSAEWNLYRSERLPEHCRLLTQVDSGEFQSGDIVNVSEDWITGASTTFASGTIPLREWLLSPSGELMDTAGGPLPYRSIGIGYGKEQFPLGCVLVNANGNIQTYEGIEAVQDVISKIESL